MRKVFLGVIIFLYCLKIQPAFASAPPVQSSPGNGSIVSSSTLTWQTPDYQLYPTTPYRIQVDDDQSFASPNKDSNTANTFYTPQLDNGSWFWRMKAKDSSGVWSDWSSTWQFTLSDATPAPSTTSTPTPDPNSSPSPFSQAPTSDPTPKTTEFTLSDTPSQIDSNQIFTVKITLKLPNSPNTIFYLKGAFAEPGSSNYFGQTKVGDSWIKNSSTYSSQKQITTDNSGTWIGTLDIQPDPSDSGYQGSDDYIFKVGRYTSGSNLTWSNDVTININNLASGDTSLASTTPSSTPSPSLKPSSTPKSTASALASVASESALLDYKIGSVAGIHTTSTPSPTSLPSRFAASISFNYYFLAAGLLTILAGIASILYITKGEWLKERINEIYHKLTRRNPEFSETDSH